LREISTAFSFLLPSFPQDFVKSVGWIFFLTVLRSGGNPMGKSNRNRCDASGRAFAGSQRQIQHYVNEQQSVLNGAISAALSLQLCITWTSPLRSDRYREYKDSAFLRVLGLDSSRTDLSRFWPRGGPVWDALGIVSGASQGVLLLEAKSHVPEISGSGCGAKADLSIKKIEASLAMTKLWLDVGGGADWKGELYQTANRLAHLYFFREILHINAWLVNVYFTADPRSPTSQSQWDVAVADAKRALGMSRIPFYGDVYLPAVC
jgi:hypothetical protein